MSSDDSELVERCREGDLSAFEPLVEKYRQRVWRLAFQILRDREEAWDVAQEAFVRAWQSLPAFRGQSAFYTWVFRIVVNLATDRQRAGVEPGDRVDSKEVLKKLTAVSISAYCEQCTPKTGMVLVDNLVFQK